MDIESELVEKGQPKTGRLLYIGIFVFLLGIIFFMIGGNTRKTSVYSWHYHHYRDVDSWYYHGYQDVVCRRKKLRGLQ